MEKLERLFSPLNIKSLTIKNRFLRSPMESTLGVLDGTVTEDHIRMYTNCAKGGCGLMMIEGIGVHPAGRFYATMITAYDDNCIPGFQRLTDSCKAHGDGCSIWAQLHCGGATNFGYSYGQDDNGIDLNVFDETMIREIIDGYANAALRCKKGGFDGVEIHGAHGYLVAQFVSPAINNRTDEWGGSLENRIRFPLEILKRIRELCGDDYPVGIKMNIADFLPGGHWMSDTQEIARIYAKAGYDLIEASGGMGMMIELRESLRQHVGDNKYYFSEAIPSFLEAIKGTDTKLCVTGGIGDPADMEDMLLKGVDLIGLARPWLCEPDLANRIQAGDQRPVRCVSRTKLCNLCLNRIALGPVTCYKFYPGYCRMTCPLDQNTPEYISKIAHEEFDEAVKVIRKDNPLPTVLCKVCSHTCESGCRGQTGEPLAIRDLKRFAMDYAKKNSVMTTANNASSQTGARVAIVGSGPAGLSCALQLAMAGYRPTVFEKLKVKGGAMRTAIPRYRLPAEDIDIDILYIESAGVEIKTGMALGQDFKINDLFDQGFKAVFIAVGASVGVRLEVPGAELKGVLVGLDLLCDVNAGKSVKVGERVVVVGGGSVAVDAAQTALRLGAHEVNMVCLEQPGEMPANKEELADALAEGVVIHNGWGVRRITGAGAVEEIELIKCTSVFDDENRFAPIYDESVAKSLKADTVIMATGQRADLSCLDEEAKKSLECKNRISADEQTLLTAIPGVFAGGDVVSGPKDVVHAAAAGKTAAESIDRYIRGLPLARTPKDESYGLFFKGEASCVDPELLIKEEGSLRAIAEKLPASKRRNSFDEIVQTLTADAAVKEARRCLKYDDDLEEKSAQRLANAGAATPLFKRVTGSDW